MSQANIINITPTISLSTAQTVPLLLASVALEELSLAHLLNAEAEKTQFVLGTLPIPGREFIPGVVSLTNLLTLDASLQRTLSDVIKKEMLLEFKFENTLDLISTLPSCQSSVTLSNGAMVQFLSLSPDGKTWSYQLTLPTPPAFYDLILYIPCATNFIFVNCTNSDPTGLCGNGLFPGFCGNPNQFGVTFRTGNTPSGLSTFNFSFTLTQQLPIGSISAVLFVGIESECFNICGPVC